MRQRFPLSTEAMIQRSQREKCEDEEGEERKFEMVERSSKDVSVTRCTYTGQTFKIFFSIAKSRKRIFSQPEDSTLFLVTQVSLIEIGAAERTRPRRAYAALPLSTSVGTKRYT